MWFTASDISRPLSVVCVVGEAVDHGAAVGSEDSDVGTHTSKLKKMR